MKTYKITLKHDLGTYSLKVKANDEESARVIVMNAERCPSNAIVRLKLID